MKRISLLVVGLGGLVLSGCVSTGMARIVDPGRFQFSAAPAAQISVGGSAFGSNIPAPQLELGARYGVTERLDVGARVYFPGAEADVRFGLLRAPSLQSGVDLTLAPSANFMFLSTDTPWIVSLPLLIGLNLNGSQLTIGPRVSYILPGRENPATPFLVGTSVGYSFPLTPSIRFSTELSALTPPTSFGVDGVLCRAGIGFIFGGYEEE